MSDLIAVATYRRNPQLEQCVSSLHSQLAPDDILLIIDNDPDGNAQPVVSGLARTDQRIRYVHEPRPGIAAARNRALAYRTGGEFEAIVFIDDDEVASPDALWKHRRHPACSTADATFGPVSPVYDRGVQRWVRALEPFARNRQQSGEQVRWPATNNVRIRASFFKKCPGLTFSEDWSDTGGSDTDFFYRARLQGADLRWVDDAIVFESVSTDRANFRWIWRRGLRLGNVSARILATRGFSRPSIIATAIARMLATPALCVVALIRKRPIGPVLWNVPKGLGMMRAVRGKLLREYAR